MKYKQEQIGVFTKGAVVLAAFIFLFCATRTECRAEQNKTRKYKIHKVWLWQETKDCLWNIAKKYYGDPRLWREIYLANQNEIEDPRVIHPRQELIIPILEDK